MLALSTAKLILSTCSFIVFVTYISIQEQGSQLSASCVDAVYTSFLREIPGERSGYDSATTLGEAFEFIQDTVFPALDDVVRLDGQTVPITTPEFMLLMGDPKYYAYYIKDTGCSVMPELGDEFGGCYTRYDNAIADTTDLPGAPFDADAPNFSSRETKLSYGAGANDVEEAVFRNLTAAGGGDAIRSPSLRGLRMKFGFYNPHVDAVGALDLMYEVTEAGVVTSSSQTNFVTLVRPPLEDGTGASATFGADWAVLVFAFLAFGAHLRIIKLQKRELGQGLQPVDYVTVPNLFLLFAVAVTRISLVYVLYTKWEDALVDPEVGSELVTSALNIFFLTKAINAWNSLLSFAAILCYLRQVPKCKQLIDSLSLAALDMFAILALLAIALLAFSTSMYLIYGGYDPSFRDLEESMTAMFAATLGSFPKSDTIVGRSVFFGPFLYVAFIVILRLGLVGLFVSLVDDAYAAVAEGKFDEGESTSLQQEFYDIYAFFKGIVVKARDWFFSRPIAPMAGADEAKGFTDAQGKAGAKGAEGKLEELKTPEEIEKEALEMVEYEVIMDSVHSLQAERAAVNELRERLSQVASIQDELRSSLIESARMDGVEPAAEEDAAAAFEEMQHGEEKKKAGDEDNEDGPVAWSPTPKDDAAAAPKPKKKLGGWGALKAKMKG
mmetsp:Transcript_19743/g.59794  ORF Transcript_19743/g.59794 Transcript_19743/m.59794 type:complete len:667 (-) Transcript_19743:124-2124(-)